MNRIIAAALTPLLLSLTACISLKVGTPGESTFTAVGVISGYGQIEQPPGLKGPIFEANLLGGREPGELVSLDLWSFGIGAGFLGARLNLPFFETGLGTLFYQPHPLYGGGGSDEGKSKKTEVKSSITD